MHPRLRTLALFPCLLVALCFATAAPAFATPLTPACVFETPGTEPAGIDTTSSGVPPLGWQRNDVTVNLTGTAAVTSWQWSVDCSGVQQTTVPGSSVVINISGRHILSHRAFDGTGWTDWTDDEIDLDKTTPLNMTSAAPAWSKGPFQISVNGSDSTSSVPLVHWQLDTGPAQSGPSGSLVPVSGEGSHTLISWVEDAAGNASGQRTDYFGIDSGPPVDQTVVPNGWQYNSTSIVVRGTDATSGVLQVQWKIDGALSTGAPNAGAPIPEGTHSFQTQIMDAAGNVSGWSPVSTVKVDTTPPLDTTTPPPGWQKTPTVNVLVTGTDPNGSGVDHVDWQLDGQSGSALGISHVVAVTGEGDHLLRTRIVDAGGHDSGWTDHHVLIDTVVPTDNTTASAGWQTQPVDVTVTGDDGTNGSGVDHVDWQLDNGGTQTATGTSQVVHISGDGWHTLYTRIADAAGNVTGWKPTTVRIDASAPHNTTDRVPNTAWRSTPYTVQLTGDDDVSGIKQMHYKIDSGLDTTGPSGVLQATVKGDGTHTLSTWAEDVAGNTSGPRSETVNIDSVAPTDLTTVPGVPVQNNYPVTINGSDAMSGVANVQWKLDTGSVQSGPDGSIFTITGAGPHVLKTQIVDNAGNLSGWKTSAITVDLSLTPDTTPPVDTSTSSSSAWASHSVSMTVSATDAGVGVQYMEYRLDGQVFGPFTTPQTVTVTGNGPHLFETHAVDFNGNDSGWRMQTVNIDMTQPTDTSIMPAANAWTNTRTFTLSGDDAMPGSGVKWIDYTIDGGALQHVPSGGTVTVPSDGTHTIWHRPVDNAGLAAGVGVTSTFKVDTVAPVNMSGTAPTPWQTSAVSLPLTGSDALSGVARAEWRVNGGVTTPSYTAAVSADGVQLLETRIVDNAGNASAWRPETVKVDTTAPTNTTSQPAGGWQNTTYTTSVAGTDATSGVAGIEWTLDGGSTVTTPSVSISTAGTHFLRSRIKDAAGNYSIWRTDTINIDKTAPTLSVDCGPADWRSTPAVCSVAADGGASGLSAVTASVGDGITDAVTGGSYTVAGDGNHSLTFRAVDGAGNEKLALAQVKVDRTRPSASVSCTPDSGTAYVCTAGGSDALSGLGTLTWSVDGGAPTAIATGGSFIVAKGTVTVTATDRAGNSAASTLKLGVRKASTGGGSSTDSTPTVTARTTSEAVLRTGRGTIAARALGELELKALPSSTTAVLRPMALGKGRFHITLTVTADRKHKTYSKTISTRSGYSPQVSLRLGGAVSVRAKLTIKRRSGSRWVTLANGSAKL